MPCDIDAIERGGTVLEYCLQLCRKFICCKCICGKTDKMDFVWLLGDTNFGWGIAFVAFASSSKKIKKDRKGFINSTCYLF